MSDTTVLGHSVPMPAYVGDPTTSWRFDRQAGAGTKTIRPHWTPPTTLTWDQFGQADQPTRSPGTAKGGGEGGGTWCPSPCPTHPPGISVAALPASGRRATPQLSYRLPAHEGDAILELAEEADPDHG